MRVDQSPFNEIKIKPYSCGARNNYFQWGRVGGWGILFFKGEGGGWRGHVPSWALATAASETLSQFD